MATTESNPTQQQSPGGSEANLSEPRVASELPHPEDFPNADVVIYDGNCVFCTKQVKNLMRLDGKNRLAFVSLHDEFVANAFPDLSYEQMMEQIYLIPNLYRGKTGQSCYTSQRLGGAFAIRHLTCRLPKLWILAPLLHIPLTMPVWQWGYTQVANRRYKIAGKTGPQCDENGTCDLHFKD